MSLVEDIGAALTSAGYSNLRYWRFDSSSVDQICIIPFGGTAYIVSGGDIEHPNLQIQVRDAVLKTAHDRAAAIKTLLHKNTAISNQVFMHCDRPTPDYWTDENDLHVFSVEFKIIRCV